MAFELSFSPEFFFREGEPYDITDNWKSDRPTSVWQAIMNMPDEDWNAMCAEVFDRKPLYVTPEMVLEQIRKVNTCHDLRSPVEVYIDEDGWHSVLVYDKEES